MQTISKLKNLKKYIFPNYFTFPRDREEFIEIIRPTVGAVFSTVRSLPRQMTTKPALSGLLRVSILLPFEDPPYTLRCIYLPCFPPRAGNDGKLEPKKGDITV